MIGEFAVRKLSARRGILIHQSIQPGSVELLLTRDGPFGGVIPSRQVHDVIVQNALQPAKRSLLGKTKKAQQADLCLDKSILNQVQGLDLWLQDFREPSPADAQELRAEMVEHSPKGVLVAL